jgi:hypothetical protein
MEAFCVRREVNWGRALISLALKTERYGITGGYMPEPESVGCGPTEEPDEERGGGVHSAQGRPAICLTMFLRVLILC